MTFVVARTINLKTSDFFVFIRMKLSTILTLYRASTYFISFKHIYSLSHIFMFFQLLYCDMILPINVSTCFITCSGIIYMFPEDAAKFCENI